MNQILSIDPGTEKCGLLLADIDENIVLKAKVLRKDLVLKIISQWFYQYSIKLTIIGDGTNSEYWRSKIIALNFSKIKLVSEEGTTLRARYRYWEIYPPGRLISFIPKSMLLPPKDLDAIAALILLEDYLQKKITWQNGIDFKTLP